MRSPVGGVASKAEGIAGQPDRSARPHRCPRRTPVVEEQVLHLRSATSTTIPGRCSIWTSRRSAVSPTVAAGKPTAVPWAALGCRNEPGSGSTTCTRWSTTTPDWPTPRSCPTSTAPWLRSYHPGRRHAALGGQPRPADCHERPPGTTRPSQTVAEGRIQIAKQLPDAPSTRQCRGVAAEHVNDDWRRAPASLLKVSSTDISIIARQKFGRSRRVGRCPQNVLHLVSVGQGMQVRSGCRAHRCSRRIARGRGVCVSGRLERRPRGVAQCLPAFATSSERPCGVDRVARAGVGRVCALEDLQDCLRALSGIPGDLTKVLPAQNDLAGFVRHGYRPCLPNLDTATQLLSARERYPG
jgi:hypothetical protein